MKLYQLTYQNADRFAAFLAGIRAFCGETQPGDITFYFTWAQEAAADLDTVTAMIEKAFPDAIYYGNEASGSIAQGGFTLGIQIACTIFEAADARAELVWVEEGTPISSLDDLWAYCAAKQGLRAVEMIPSMSYVETLQIDGSIPPLGDDVLIFGGASVNYDTATYDADILAKGHPRTQNGMAVMLYFGKSLNFSSASVLGWKGLGKHMEVTDSTGKCIRAINGSPAYSVYEHYLNLTMEDRDTLVFPLIVEEDGFEFIRTPQIIMPDRSMQMFANIPKGAKVRIAYGDKNTILNGIREKAENFALLAPEAIKVYSCAARRLFWGDKEVGRETEILEEIAPVCGFYTGGEILRFGKKLRVLNQTLALVGLREGENAEPVRIAASDSGIDKSLISRLTYFSEKIVAEETAQRRLAETFEQILSAEYQVMYLIDLKGDKATFLHGDEAAKQFKAMFDSSSPDTMFENFYRYYVDTLVAEEDRARVKAVMNEQNVQRVLKTSNSVSVNYRVRRDLLNPVYTEMRIFRAGVENGELTSVILAFKLTDEELRTALELQEKLAEQSAFNSYFLEPYESAYYIGLDDLSWQVYKRGEQDERTYPRQEDYLCSLSRFIMTEVHPDDREQISLLVHPDELKARLAVQPNIRFLFRKREEEKDKIFRCEIIRGADDAHAAFGFMNVTQEVESQRREELRLQEALEAADAASKSKTSFLFNMSHDIRTPMNAIKGFTAMAKKYRDDRDRVADYLDKIDISGQQLITLINQVLEMARIESGKIEFNEQPVNVAERFNSMVTVVEAQAESKGLDFHSALVDLKHTSVLADDARMGQITLNIVGNAIKYTPEGGRIDFTMRELPCETPGFARYVFSVADTGIGMSAEFQQHLFEPFTREETSTVSRIQGTGLGMSIVKSLVDLKGGSIDVDSAPGKGTKIAITLDFPIAEEAWSLSSGSEKANSVSFEGMRVLLVEDNEMNREIARDILEEYGFLVEEADDGDTAVEMCRKIVARRDYHYYDFILMDIQMPRMNGYEATRAIRAIPSPDSGHIPIIAMTANAFEEDRRNALASGMDEHLAKPIEIPKLLSALAKFI